MPFLPTPKLGSQDTPVFERLMLLTTAIAGAAHAVFAAVFVWVGVTPMAWINLASVLCYVLAALLIRQHVLLPALLLMGSEIVCHSVLAVWLIGWGTGFHFYVILIVPVAIFSTSGSWALRASLAVAAGLGYMLMDWIFGRALPPIALPEAVLHTLHYFNLASALTILALLALLYRHLVQKAEAKLQVLACTDPLTQLHNRRFAMEVAQHEAAVYQRGGRPLALVIGDIDHFKQVNDQHGHAQGDRALKAVARVLRDGVREVDHVARWGGEEFLMLLPGTDEDEAEQVAQRLRESVGSLSVDAGAVPRPLSITRGVTVLGREESVEQALARADRALYLGKQAGRNRVVVAAQA